ncbi:MAG: ATP-dependent 6-phosphofructokinase [Victivallales bacterium]|nr:ATP-dependent 6-phosphofructokinase [Victivallales bacterium]
MINDKSKDGLNFEIKELNNNKVSSPLDKIKDLKLEQSFFIDDKKDRLKYDVHSGVKPEDLTFEIAGPRKKLHFAPSETTVAVVTCGGLCPGLNDVIRALVMELVYWYEVKDIWGIRYGYSGLAENPEYPPVPLTPSFVTDINQKGGTVLGSSRGGPPTKEIVQTLARMDVNILFCIGGDGTLRGAHAIAEEVQNKNLNISVVGIPKTIDNDIPFVYKSFGFQTAVEMASKILDCAHVEAKGAKNGVGLVKLMGRDAGFISSYATRANGNVNFCLIPEMKLHTEGKGWFYEKLRERILSREHAVVAVAEGAGQHLIGSSGNTDASGNKKYNDIGRFIRFDSKKYFKEKWDMDLNVKYFSPSYTIRSVPANSQDSIFCADLARYAVDAAMSGKTDLMIGHWHGEFTHVPLNAVKKRIKRVRRDSRLWTSVLTCTGQPVWWW